MGSDHRRPLSKRGCFRSMEDPPGVFCGDHVVLNNLVQRDGPGAAQVAISIISFYLGVFQAGQPLLISAHLPSPSPCPFSLSLLLLLVLLLLLISLCPLRGVSQCHHSTPQVACTSPSTCSGYQLSRYILHALCPLTLLMGHQPVSALQMHP